MSVPVIDSHVHLYHKACIDYFQNYYREHGFDYVNFACLCCAGYSSTGNNLLAAAAKLADPHFYAHGGLYYPAAPVQLPMPEGWDFLTQAKELLDMGFDGMKMLETKPTTAKAHALPVSDMAYDPYFAYLEETGTHIVWHACDPETFWDLPHQGAALPGRLRRAGPASEAQRHLRPLLLPLRLPRRGGAGHGDLPQHQLRHHPRPRDVRLLRPAPGYLEGIL